MLGPATQAGADLADLTADDLTGLVAYLQFVATYSDAIGNVIRLPADDGDYLMATQQFLMASDPCRLLVDVPDCSLPTIDPGPQVADAG